MTPATLNLTIYRGITFGPIVITCKDSDGVVVDLTGYSVFADARKDPLNVNTPIAFSLDPEITDADAGEITMTFTDEQAETKPLGKFGWDLVLQNPAGERLGPFIVGKVTVKLLNTQP